MDARKTEGGKWVDVIAEADLCERGRAVVRVGKKQLAVFQTPEGVRACNNRCPHEGFPLAEGSLDEGCVLTCNWHNWKFQLSSGDNLFGGDALRTYPTEVRDGRVWIDASDPPAEQSRNRHLTRLSEAIDDDSYDRIAREVARLLRLEMEPAAIVAHAISHAAPHLEFGTTHAFAALPDWLLLREELRDDADKLACLVEPLAHMARDTLREPRFEFAQASKPYSPEALLAAVESEDRELSEALVRGALEAGTPDAELRPVFAQAALSHYAGFGHSLIYTQKAFEAIARLGASVREPLLLSLVRSLVYAQREDLIPEFRGYAAALEKFGSEDGAALSVDALTNSGVEGALSAVVAGSQRRPEELYDVLLTASARRALCFDTHWERRFDRPVTDNVGWLGFSHPLTFANAVRELCSETPELWPAGLLQMACFIGRNRRYVSEQPPAEYQGATATNFAELSEVVLDHGSAEPIVSAHGIKTFVAVRREHELGLGGKDLPLALDRMLHSPMKRRHVRRIARQSLAFVGRED